MFKKLKTIGRTYLAIALVPTMALLASCQTSGGNVFSDAAPKADGENQQVATAQQAGRNPNAASKLKNTKNSLSDYCPALAIRSGTESYRIYAKAKNKSLESNLRYQATILKVARECKYVGDQLEIIFGARGRIITGPSGGPGKIQMPIRIAIQQGGCSRHFKLYKSPAEVKSGNASAIFQFVSEKVVIPAPDGVNVRMFMGFDPENSAKPSTSVCT